MDLFISGKFVVGGLNGEEGLFEKKKLFSKTGC